MTVSMNGPSARLDGQQLQWLHFCSFFGEWDERSLPIGPNGWALVAAEPLTISPSILCRNCGVHGFIQEGQWVPA